MSSLQMIFFFSFKNFLRRIKVLKNLWLTVILNKNIDEMYQNPFVFSLFEHV